MAINSIAHAAGLTASDLRATARLVRHGVATHEFRLTGMSAAEIAEDTGTKLPPLHDFVELQMPDGDHFFANLVVPHGDPQPYIEATYADAGDVATSYRFHMADDGSITSVTHLEDGREVVPRQPGPADYTTANAFTKAYAKKLADEN